MSAINRTVVIVGASDREDRYSYKALKMLHQHKFKVIPVHPTLQTIHGISVKSSLDQIDEPVDTVTIYVGPQRLPPLVPSIKKLSPRKVVFNPGTESPQIEEELTSQGIEVIEGCTLVMLRSGQF